MRYRCINVARLLRYASPPAVFIRRRPITASVFVASVFALIFLTGFLTSLFRVEDRTISIGLFTPEGRATTITSGQVVINTADEVFLSVELINSYPEGDGVFIIAILKTYYGETGNEYTLKGHYDDPINAVYVGGTPFSPAPTGGEWHKSGITLNLGQDNKAGDNPFTIYGSDGSNQTATQVVHVERHLLGDIDGLGTVDLGDASMLATDYGKTENLTYALSNMNYDQDNPDDVVDITDLSILARNWTN